MNMIQVRYLGFDEYMKNDFQKASWAKDFLSFLPTPC